MASKWAPLGFVSSSFSANMYRNSDLLAGLVPIFKRLSAMFLMMNIASWEGEGLLACNASKISFMLFFAVSVLMHRTVKSCRNS